MSLPEPRDKAAQLTSKSGADPVMTLGDWLDPRDNALHRASSPFLKGFRRGQGEFNGGGLSGLAVRQTHGFGSSGLSGSDATVGRFQEAAGGV